MSGFFFIFKFQAIVANSGPDKFIFTKQLKIFKIIIHSDTAIPRTQPTFPHLNLLLQSHHQTPIAALPKSRLLPLQYY